MGATSYPSKVRDGKKNSHFSQVQSCIHIKRSEDLPIELTKDKKCDKTHRDDCLTSWYLAFVERGSFYP